MSKRSDGLLCRDIMDACGKIQAYTADYSREQFLTDEKTMDAVIRNFRRFQGQKPAN